MKNENSITKEHLSLLMRYLKLKVENEDILTLKDIELLLCSITLLPFVTRMEDVAYILLKDKLNQIQKGELPCTEN